MKKVNPWIILALGTSGLLMAFSQVAAQSTERISLDSNTMQVNGSSSSPSISEDGRYIVFQSDASNLVDNDTNGTQDVFVRDRQTGVTTRISVDSDESQVNGSSSSPSISEDGRYIVFQSDASNLVDNDTNGTQDVFVRDRQTGVTTRISVDSDESQVNGSSSSPSISEDGRYVSFQSDASNLVDNDTNGTQDVFVRDRQTGVTTRISVDSDELQVNGSSSSPSISEDGRYVSFQSDASNLVDNDTNGTQDVFARLFPAVSPTHDATGEWTLEETAETSGCGEPTQVDTGTATITQSRNNIVMNVTISGNSYTYTGTVSGKVYTVFSQFVDAGKTKRQYMAFTLSTDSSGSGVVTWVVTDSTGQILLCEGTTEFTVEKRQPDGNGGGCFICTMVRSSSMTFFLVFGTAIAGVVAILKRYIRQCV